MTHLLVKNVLINVKEFLKIKESAPRIRYLEDFEEETAHSRKLCLLLFEPIWYYFIFIIGFVNSVETMLNCIYCICNSTEYTRAEICYFGDLVWFFNTTLYLICKFGVTDLKSTQVIFTHRGLYVCLIDYISVMPIELFTPVTLQHYVALNRMLMGAYIIWLFDYLDSMLDTSVAHQILGLLFKLCYFLVLASLIFTLILVRVDSNYERYSLGDILYIVTDHMTLKGFGQIASQHYWNKLLAMICSLILFVGILILGTAKLTFTFITETMQKTTFCYKYNTARKEYKELPEFCEVLDIFFDTMWTHGAGQEEAMGGRRRFQMPGSRVWFDLGGRINILPDTFMKDITLDMCTGMFKHSILLCDIQVPFLRELSRHATFEVYMQYQFVIKLNEIKNRMIYIYKGIVEIISDEDGDTPLVRLTAGTVLSEISLMLPTKSTFMVRCATACTFHVISRAHFINILSKYPAVRRSVNLVMKDRLENAQTLKRIQDIYNTRANARNACTNVGWVLHQLHTMIAVSYPIVAHQHMLPELNMKQSMHTNKFHKHIFKPTYLPLYAVPEEKQDYKDTLFAKSTFPYMIKSNTGLTIFWEIFITILAISAGILLPYYALTYRKNDRWPSIEHIAYFFTIIWALDIVIQLRISVFYKKILVSGFFEILFFKLTNFIFTLDVLSIVPVELFSVFLVKESYYNVVYMNRILKLSRVITLVKMWDSHYNVNPLVVRFVCSIALLVYSIFLFACIFYQLGYIGEGGQEEFEKLLFYSNQMLTSVAIWVDGYSQGFPPYQMLNIFLYFFICVNYAMLYGMILSAYASSLLHLVQIKFKTQQLIKAAIQIDPRYKLYIHDVLTDTVSIHQGLTLHWPHYLYSAVPMEIIGHIYSLKYEAYMEEFKIFGNFTPQQRKRMFEQSGFVRYYAAHEVVFHTGDLLDEVFLLIHGCVEIICGVTLKSSFATRPTDLNCTEVSLILPMRKTVVTHSHCVIIRMRYSTIRRMDMEIGSRLAIRSQLGGMRDIRARILHARLKYFHHDVLESCRNDTMRRSFFFCKHSHLEQLVVYKITGMVNVRHFLMPVTFSPHGKFLYAWEIVRCICAVLSAFLFTSITVCFYKIPHPFGFCKWIFELMAFTDLFVRMHVAYYNEEALLVSHPAMTAINYWKHGFLIDLVGALPLHLFITKAEHVLVNLNKLLQLHRYVSLMRFKVDDSVSPMNKFYMFAHLPALLIYINMMSSLYLLLNCEFDITNPTNVTIKCSGEDGNVDNFQAHLMAIYMILSVCSKTGVQGFYIVKRSNMLLIAVMTVVGFCLEVFHAARIYGYFITMYLEVTYSEVRLRLVKAFLNAKTGKESRVLPSLVREAEEHLNRMWIMRSSNVYFHAQGYPSNLRRDILYHKFGPALVAALLPDARDVQPFVRNILINAEYRVLGPRAYVQRRDDICEYTIILYSGFVFMDLDEFGEKGISLGPGSIIGNLCPLQYNRLKSTISSIGELELLYIKTNKFFEIMQHFRSCREKYTELRSIHISHIPGDFNFEYTYSKVKRQVISKKFYTISTVILNVLNVIGAFISQLVYFFDIISVNVYSTYYYWISDVAYISAIVITFFLPANLAKGTYTSWKDVIRNFYKPWRFYICIFSAIPFYLFVPLNIEGLYSFYLISVARSNVLLRSFFFYEMIVTTTRRSTWLMYSLTLAGHICIIVLTVGAATALMILISEVDPANMKPLINLEQLRDTALNEKLDHTITHLYIVTNMFTHTSQNLYYPSCPTYTIIFVIIMLMVMIYNTAIYVSAVSLVQAINQLKSSYLIQKKSHILAWMYRSDTSLVLKQRVDYHCKMNWIRMMGTRIPPIFEGLPLYLREDIAHSLFNSILDEHPFFSQIHDQFRRQLYSKLKLEYYYHGDYIAYHGTVSETMYFVHSGMVVALASDHTTELAKIAVGGYFSTIEGITGSTAHICSYRAITDSVVLYLDKSAWAYMMHFFPASRDILQQVYTKLLEKEHMD